MLIFNSLLPITVRCVSISNYIVRLGTWVLELRFLVCFLVAIGFPFLEYFATYLFRFVAVNEITIAKVIEIVNFPLF